MSDDIDHKFPTVLKPIWEPYNDVAVSLVDEVVKRQRYPSTGPKERKYRVIIASFLKALQEVDSAQRRSRATDRRKYLGVRFRSETWSPYALVGAKVGTDVTRDLLKNFKLTKVAGSGDSNIYKDEEGKWQSDPLMSMYEIVQGSLPDDLRKATFIQTGLQRVKINEAETRQQRDLRRKEKGAKPYLNESTAANQFVDLYRATESRIQRLNEYWLKHPIKLPSGHLAASATRVYHDGRMDAGGRLYGAWTGLDKETARLKCLIDDEPICELDIKASQPTLFSCLTGYRLGGRVEGDTWLDVYSELSGLWSVVTHWSEQDPLIDKIDLINRNRKFAKGVVVELIGSGNWSKKEATEDLKNKFHFTQAGWVTFRDQLNRTIPAFELLEPRYDNQGNLAGYMNGAGFLSYHESEMMMLTLEKLIDLNIPAYPVHDCLMVKVKDAKIAAKTFRDVIRQYCLNLSGLDVLVPLSVEVLQEVNAEHLPSNSDLIGRYLN